MRVVVIGGTGHIGSFLTPGLVRAGHDVVVVSRGRRRPYCDDPAWAQVVMQHCDRTAEEQHGVFGRHVAALRPDVVMDLTCFTAESARQLVEALTQVHLIHTGSIWAYGRSTVVPMTEDAPRHPYGDYGIGKAAIERYLLTEQTRVRATVVHPGHISGPGWLPITPAGNLDRQMLAGLVRQGRAVLPDQGMALLQHVHAEDVAAVHLAAMERPDAAAGQAFHAVAEQSLTLRGYAELVARMYGHEPQLSFLPWPDFVRQVGAEQAAVTADHIERSPHFSMAKTERVLGFRPAHSAWATVREAIAWQVEHDELGPTGSTR